MSTNISQTLNTAVAFKVDTFSLSSYKNYFVCRKHVEVHGRPTSALFHSNKMSAGKNSYELSWEVQSFVPIQEYRLLYRKIDLVRI